ncbi:hypothetical protein DS742_14400 [Lacrimispora amygdalina]|uniref:Uncharacterized protein n=1 Tax=Lacrimispora amygdalina TaxID=253257 RepID=A0A3E2NBN8_9FIRM|nr:hypothetical protein [Clostridium indicum]RFZ78300.1 hypothetical protein DS742_14400 [Clostridium indicum]
MNRLESIKAMHNYFSIYEKDHKWNCIREQFEQERKEMNKKMRKDAYDAYASLTKINDITPLVFASSQNHKEKITDVNIIVPDKVVEVTFGDGLKEKAVCQADDVFSLEQAITICLTKHLMGGSSKYNNTISKAIKDYEKKLKGIEDDKAEKERIEKKKAKILASKQRREERRREVERAEQIAIQREAYIQAMDYLRANETK